MHSSSLQDNASDTGASGDHVAATAPHRQTIVFLLNIPPEKAFYSCTLFSPERKRMKISLTRSQRILLALVCFAVAVIGFMLKLPSSFRHIDKELHATFYFLAAAFLNILFVRKSLVRHLIIFFSLYVFGMAIEYGQAYSNKFFRNRIHGRFDPEDVQWNLKGLLAFSLLWLLYAGVVLLSRKASLKNNTHPSNVS